MSLPTTPITLPTRVEYAVLAAEVAAVTPVGRHLVRVTFRGDELRSVHAAGFDQRIKIAVPHPVTGSRHIPRATDWFAAWRAMPEQERCVLRTYTIRAARPEVGELDVDFVVHGDEGPATRWVRRARVGEIIHLVAPEAIGPVAADAPAPGVEWNPGDAARVLLAGDESAAPAICSILESLPRKARGRAFIEVPSEADVQPVAAPGGVTVTWLARESRPELEHGVALDRAVRAYVSEMVVTDDGGEGLDEIDVDADALWEVPAATPSRELYAWLAGEAGCIAGLRRHLVREVGLHRSDVAFMGYWRRGRSELG
ncbi:NADPH-dependent ferric siderophore reductase [Diaminobutyricimonas aerilata]|uniref:NADPH-dependent ferric siderophore reductase n=1 Tax=Diaminobutyricimonas aerilata TaxID=1162967 RepID=A0A2M9CLK5_9MICO|nr:siderophore-interacting protein [Diaminobutyricimonas aerilata]PJJ72760.1 NADPH-dependent ferric siderophore reductase [Diaminobutyricimonas aerilata]